jgi:hypothetical protein
MKIYDSPQGTAEWLQDRAGVITASNFLMVRSKVGMLNEQQQKYVDAIRAGKGVEAAKSIAGYKAAPTSTTIQKALDGEPVGDWSDKAKDYAFRLAVERISGEAVDVGYFETYAMRRGKELEEDCRRLHEDEIGVVGDLHGFITTDDDKFGCSADLLVEDDGGAEYKCFYASDKVRPIIIDGNWGDISDQVQGCLWITGRKWWDQCLYFPALDCIGKGFTRRRVFRDVDYIESLEQDLIEFDKLVCSWEAKLRAA